MEMEAESDDEFSDFPSGEKAVKFSGNMKAKIRAPWANALLVKVFGKIVGFHFLHSRILGLWKLVGRMDYVDLGNDFFLIRFQNREDHARVFREGPWFVGGHYLSIKGWEPNFKSLTANLSSIVVWIRLSELPIEYYEPSALREINEAIGPMLRIDTHTAAKTRGRFARLCVQVNLDESIMKLLKMRGIDQPVQYEGINSLCFAYGRVGHRAEKCPYKVRAPTRDGGVEDAGKKAEVQSQPASEELQKLKLVLLTPNDKSLAQSLKIRKKGQELPTRKEIREFKAGSSTNMKVVEARPSLEREEVKRIGGVNQGDLVDEEISDYEEEPGDDQLRESDLPDAYMKDDVGGDIPFPS
nr:uncharacterized protein CFP56_20132 [Quercus suber]